MEKSNKRELLPDVIRGFAIFLVVLGHCIQEGSGADFKTNAMYFQDKGYQFIYSFHMPLFMMISGYYGWNSMEKARKKGGIFLLLGRRSKALLLPVFGWTCFDYIRTFLEHGTAYPVFQSAFTFIKSFTVSMFTNLWFLWAVFWCFLIVFFVHFYCKDSVFVYVVGFLLLFVIPDGAGLVAYKFMLPYFIVAFYFRGWQENGRLQRVKKLQAVNQWVPVLVLGVLFGVLFCFFDAQSLIYLSGYKLVGKDISRQLGIDAYRTLVGFVGSGFFILLWKCIINSVPKYRFPVLSALGKESLGIYIISGYVILLIGTQLWKDAGPDYRMNLLQAVAVTVISYGITRVLKGIPILKKLVG